MTPAARLLDLKSHQTLIYLIEAQHKELLNTRLAVRKRRSHIFSKPRKIKKKAVSVHPRAASQIFILHVEDNKAVASLVKESLELEGWKIETCADGNLALEKIASDTRYDLILLDNALPGVNGLQLIQHARSMPHRQKTPIVMLSATVDDAGAREAGADIGLHKPEEIGSLADTIARVLKRERTGDQSLVSEKAN